MAEVPGQAELIRLSVTYPASSELFSRVHALYEDAPRALRYHLTIAFLKLKQTSGHLPAAQRHQPASSHHQQDGRRRFWHGERRGQD